MLYRKPSPSRVMASPSPSHQRTSQRCSVRTCQAGASEGVGAAHDGGGYASRAMLPGRGGAGEGRGEEGRRSEEKRGEGRRGGVSTVVLRPPLLWKDAKSRLPSSNAPTVLARAPDATRAAAERWPSHQPKPPARRIASTSTVPHPPSPPPALSSPTPPSPLPRASWHTLRQAASTAAGSPSTRYTYRFHRHALVDEPLRA